MVELPWTLTLSLCSHWQSCGPPATASMLIRRNEIPTRTLDPSYRSHKTFLWGINKIRILLTRRNGLRLLALYPVIPSFIHRHWTHLQFAFYKAQALLNMCIAIRVSLGYILSTVGFSWIMVYPYFQDFYCKIFQMCPKLESITNPMCPSPKFI